MRCSDAFFLALWSGFLMDRWRIFARWWLMCFAVAVLAAACAKTSADEASPAGGGRGGRGGAAATRDFLVSRGVAGKRLKTISYGKERPVAVCDDISCWSQNRRAVTVLNGAGS